MKDTPSFPLRETITHCLEISFKWLLGLYGIVRHTKKCSHCFKQSGPMFYTATIYFRRFRSPYITRRKDCVCLLSNRFEITALSVRIHSFIAMAVHARNAWDTWRRGTGSATSAIATVSPLVPLSRVCSCTIDWQEFINAMSTLSSHPLSLRDRFTLKADSIRIRFSHEAIFCCPISDHRRLAPECNFCRTFIKGERHRHGHRRLEKIRHSAAAADCRRRTRRVRST